MNILAEKPSKLFIKYLLASFGSALVMSIYSLVDAICVGQYEAKDGTAALACVMPLWTIIFSTGLLFGIGGSTLMSSFRGKNDQAQANQYFTLSFIMALIASIFLWILVNIFEEPLLIFFGAKDSIVLELAKKYVFWMKIILPVFLFTQYLSTIVRADNNPILSTISVISGGIFNCFGDIYFVFGLKMGISGAGLATMIGQILSLFVLLIHFFTPKRSVKIIKPTNLSNKIISIISVGISAFILDIGMGIVTIIYNNQINIYSSDSTNALAIYGVITNIVALVQSFAYAIGQANQPLIATNYGAGKFERVKKFLKLGIIVSVCLGVIVSIILVCIPIPILKLFTDTRDNINIINMAPKMMIPYFISFSLICYNIFQTYYFQSILKPNYSFIISIIRCLVIPLILLFTLPSIFGFYGLWYIALINETFIFILSTILLLHSYKIGFKIEN